MFFFLLAGLSGVVSAVGLFVYVQSSGGMDAALIVSGQVLDGRMLYGICALLLIAAALFFVGAVMKTVRRLVGLVALVALIAGGGIGTLSPKSLATYEQNHACQVINQRCQAK